MNTELGDRLMLAELAHRYTPQDLASMLALTYAERSNSMVDCEVKVRFKEISEAYYLVVAKITGRRT